MNIATIIGASQSSDSWVSVLLLALVAALSLFFLSRLSSRTRGEKENFRLQPDEWVVIKASPGTRRKSSGVLGLSIEGLTMSIVLTNRNIVVIGNGSAFKRRPAVDYLPVHQIKVIDGRPSVRVEKGVGTWNLEVYFSDFQETFLFRSQDECRIWAENLVMIVNQQFDGLTTEFVERKSAVSDISETLKGAIGALKSTLGSTQPSTEPTRIAGKCSSCGAQISGYSGSTVFCSYCDSHQQL